MKNNENILDLLFELKKKCSDNDNELMAELDMSQSEYHFFIAVQSEEIINSNLIAEKMGLSMSRVSRVIEKIVKKGYLQRAVDPDDRRVIKLELTEVGRQIRDAITGMRQECENRLLNRIPRDKLKEIKKNISIILEAL